MPAVPGLASARRSPCPTSTSSGVSRIDDRRHLHLERLDLLAEVFRRAADHQPGDEHRDIANTSMPYRPEPTPPKITSPSWISHIGTRPPSGVNESCIALTEPLDAAVVATVHRCAELRDAEARFLAFHVAAGLQRGRRLIDVQRRVAADCPPAPPRSHDQQRRRTTIGHRREHRPALARVADHAAEREAQRRRDEQDREHLAGSSRAASGSRTDAPSSR